jgi:Mg2+-importing ATPase
MIPSETNPDSQLPKGQELPQAALKTYWQLPSEQLLSALQSTQKGLQQTQAEIRIKQYGLNTLKTQRQATALQLFFSQFKSPLVLILIFAAIVSAFLGEWTDAVIVLAVVIGSTMLGFEQEYRTWYCSLRAV